MRQTLTLRLEIELDNIRHDRCPMLIPDETPGSLICYRYGTPCKYKNRENCPDHKEYVMRGK